MVMKLLSVVMVVRWCVIWFFVLRLCSIISIMVGVVVMVIMLFKSVMIELVLN